MQLPDAAIRLGAKCARPGPVDHLDPGHVASRSRLGPYFVALAGGHAPRPRGEEMEAPAANIELSASLLQRDQIVSTRGVAIQEVLIVDHPSGVEVMAQLKAVHAFAFDIDQFGPGWLAHGGRSDRCSYEDGKRNRDWPSHDHSFRGRELATLHASTNPGLLHRGRATASRACRASQTRFTKLSTTFFTPALSKATVSLAPSMAVMRP